MIRRMADERAHLVQADRHIQEAKAHIARQLELIKKLRKDGHDTDLAESMLDALETTLRALERHRDLILDRLGEQ